MIDFVQFRKAIDRKNAAAFTLEKVKSRAERITASISGMPRGSSTGKQVEDGAIQIMEAEEALEERKKELAEYQTALAIQIHRVTDERQVQFLEWRYIEERSVPNIAIKASYSESTVYEELKKAESALNKMTAIP